ncbi:MAG: ABC transporter permease subunit [Acidobacteria bacterium]|nr:ABC transporter permease subunit [Acidobacteriota bacterium]
MKRTPISFLSSALRVFDLSIGEMLWSRRTIFMALVVAGPVLIAAITRGVASLGPVMQVNGTRIAGATIFGLMIWVFYLRFTVPVLGVFYGTSLIADEVDDKTITYLFTRPVPRGAVLFGKYLAYLVCTIFVVLPSVVLVYLLVVPIGGTLAQSFVPLLTDLGLLALGLAVYGALFAFIGAEMKRPLLTGLMFVIGWEPAAMLFPGYLRRFTVAYYLQALVPHAMPQDSATSLIQAMFRQAPPIGASLAWLFVFWLGFLYLAARAVERREYVLEQ